MKWFESQFPPYSYERVLEIERQTGERSFGMLHRVKDWRMKFEDPEVLDACEDKEEPSA